MPFIDVTISNRDVLTGRFARIPEELKISVKEKITAVTDALYEKVMFNVTGGVLQEKTGQLADSIRQYVTVSAGGAHVEGFVRPEPVTLKALVLERGGTGYYDIYPVAAKALHFIDKNGIEVFTKHVFHPPLEAKRYLGLALDEIQSGFYEAMEEMIDKITYNFSDF